MLNSLALPPQLNMIVDRVGGRRQMALLGVGIGMVVLILGLARWATAPTWVPVYTDLPLESVDAITVKLDEEAIAYRLERGGAELQVASTDLARARVALAGGGLVKEGRPGLELFDQPSWGMTDFTQRINYRRALEGELERTIGQMEGIETAQVHLALEETAGFRAEGQAAEASVVLRLRRGGTPGPEVVQGIAHLVAGSVDGIDSERVTILDQTGRLISSPWEPGSPAALASRELSMRSEIETYLETKAEQIVTQFVGPGNARVQISAEINLDRVERTVETVDPERQAIASEQRSEIIPGAEGGAGSTNVANSYMNSRTVETYAGAVGNVRRLTAAVLVSDPVTQGPEGPISQPRTQEELARIQALVQSAIGLDAARGDEISVVSIPFDAPNLEVEDGMDVLTFIEGTYRPAIMLLGLVFAFIIGMRVMRGFAPQQVEAEPASLPTPEPAVGTLSDGVMAAEAVRLEDGEDAEEEEEIAQIAPPKPAKPAGPTLRDQVMTRLDEQPDVTVRLLRAWLKEA